MEGLLDGLRHGAADIKACSSLVAERLASWSRHGKVGPAMLLAGPLPWTLPGSTEPAPSACTA